MSSAMFQALAEDGATIVNEADMGHDLMELSDLLEGQTLTKQSCETTQGPNCCECRILENIE